MIVVTGAAGFIGSALVWRLNQRRMDVLGVDRLDGPDDPKRRNLAALKLVDLLDADAFLELVLSDRVPRAGDIRAILHMGAISSTTENDADLLKCNNTDYTRKLAEYAVRRNIRFIYASSAATYGDGSDGFSDDLDSIDRLRPLNLYGESKQRFDLWARDRGLFDRIAGLKYFNVFGPNEYHKGDMRSVVLKSYEQIRDTGSVRLFKSHRPEYRDGEQIRDFLYVKDAVEMTLFFMDRPAAGLFNVGSGRPHTWIELVTPVFQAMNKPVNIVYIDMPESIRDKYQYRTLAQMQRLRESGYPDAPTPLAEAVRDYVKNYLIPGRTLEP